MMNAPAIPPPLDNPRLKTAQKGLLWSAIIWAVSFVISLVLCVVIFALGFADAMGGVGGGNRITQHNSGRIDTLSVIAMITTPIAFFAFIAVVVFGIRVFLFRRKKHAAPPA